MDYREHFVNSYVTMARSTDWSDNGDGESWDCYRLDEYCEKTPESNAGMFFDLVQSFALVNGAYLPRLRDRQFLDNPIRETTAALALDFWLYHAKPQPFGDRWIPSVREMLNNHAASTPVIMLGIDNGVIVCKQKSLV